MATAWAHTPGDPSTAALGEPSWSVRPEVVLPLLLLIGLYALGWSRLSRRGPRAIDTRRPVLVLVGLSALVLALLSPLDGLADTLFVAHMIQHMLLIMVAAPALLLADPFPLLLWGLPATARLHARRWLNRASVLGRLWRAATATRPAWIAYACVLWAWHLPRAYDAALASRWVHDVEHLSFFVGALVFWWPVIDPAPHFRRAPSYPARVVYLVLGAFQTAALGLWLTLAPAVLYRSYAARGDGPGALEDQMWGGIVMWGLGGSIEMLAVLVLVYRAMGGLATGLIDMGAPKWPPYPHVARGAPAEPGHPSTCPPGVSGRAWPAARPSPTATPTPRR